MTDYRYYKTWSRQDGLGVFPVDHAEHDEFVLQGGRRVYDFLSTSFQTNFGHSHPAIRDSIHAQLGTMSIASPKASFELKQRATGRLLQRLNLPAGKVFYATTGSEAVENALKMARQIRGATKVLARRKSYHGATLGALSVTGDWRNAPHWTLDAQTIRIPEPGDDPGLEQTRRLVAEAGADSVAAIILETITGANGVTIPMQAYYDAVTELCRSTGIMLICDEVLCGFGRTGADFALQHYGLRPDFVCLSKAITGGYIPFGAVYTSPRVAAYYDDELMACGLTNYGHPLGLAALEAVLDLLEDRDFVENRQSLERVFRETLDQWSRQPWTHEVRCKGLLAAIELEHAAPTWQECFDAGLHLYSKGNMLVVAPPLVSEPARLEEALATLGGLLSPTTAPVAPSLS